MIRRRWTVVLAVLAGAVAGSLVTTAVALGRPGPADGSGPPPAAADAPVTVPVVRQVVEDSETVSGPVGWADVELSLAHEGVLTAMPVADGAAVAPGTVVLEVNDQPVVALHMPFGLWRDVDDGDRGADVRHLHAALADLGLFDGPVDAAAGPPTWAALGAIDERLATAPLPATSVVAVEPTGATLAAHGLGVGSRLEDGSISVRRRTDRIAIDDGGLVAGYAVAGQGVRLFDSGGSEVWHGEIRHVEAVSSQTVLAVQGEAPLPSDPVAAAIVRDSTADPVLAVPRVALVPQPDGSATLRIDRGEAARGRPVVVTVGLCSGDLCEVSLPLGSDARLEEGDAVVIL